jgi:2-dehydropantoate 2-reductase
LALNVCTLPTAALLRFTADELVKHDGTLELMAALLGEAVAVANAQKIALDFDERWEVITNLLKRAVGGKASMLQDVENRRRTEIDVINGAIVAAGQQLNIPTPHNQAMVWLVKALEETF